MAAYVIAEIDVHDPASYDNYGGGVPASLAKYGGRFLVRGGAIESKEGGWQPSRLVVIEFSSMDKAREWYNSPEHQAILPIRQKAANSKVVFVEGAS